MAKKFIIFEGMLQLNYQGQIRFSGTYNQDTKQLTFAKCNRAYCLYFSCNMRNITCRDYGEKEHVDDHLFDVLDEYVLEYFSNAHNLLLIDRARRSIQERYRLEMFLLSKK